MVKKNQNQILWKELWLKFWFTIGGEGNISLKTEQVSFFPLRFIFNGNVCHEHLNPMMFNV